MKSLALLGSTGSIGRQTLELVRESGGELQVTVLTASSSWELLLEQALEFRPEVVALAQPEHEAQLREKLPSDIALRVGPQAVEEVASEAPYDLAMHGIVSARGVLPSRCVLERKKPLALANKESLVVAGEHLMELSRTRGAPILPVDSEHSAIFQCLAGQSGSAVRQIFLTASGGAFRDATPEEIARATPEEALRHPNWDMGPRITVGSATLMNKALEVIEAHHLFGLEADRIRVLIHRQSIVHSMVEFCDGSILAQLGPPDMRAPIHYAIHYPERRPSSLQGFDPQLFAQLTFEEVDLERFPTLELGFECVRLGGNAGAVLNAADEVAVEAFLASRIRFQDIARINRRVLEKRPDLAQSLEDLLEADRQARLLAQDEVLRMTRSGENTSSKALETPG